MPADRWRWLRIVAALSTALLAARPAAAGFGLIELSADLDKLALQRQRCPEEGTHAFGGCDQCLPFADWPGEEVLRVFCGPDREGCALQAGDGCSECNGLCTSAVTRAEGSRRYFLLPYSQQASAIIGNRCRQWYSEVYCVAGAMPVFGAYTFAWQLYLGDDAIEPHTGSYAELGTNPLFLERLESYGPGDGSSWTGWLHRVAVLADMVHDARGEDARYWLRALELSCWWLYGTHGPPAERAAVLAEFGLPGPRPEELDAEALADLDAIWDSTCELWQFDDCDVAVEAASWGAIKLRMRDSR